MHGFGCVVFIYLFILDGVDRREWSSLKTVTEESDFVSRAAMRDEISDGGRARVCTLSSEACVSTASRHFRNACVAGLQAGSPSIQPESRAVQVTFPDDRRDGRVVS